MFIRFGVVLIPILLVGVWLVQRSRGTVPRLELGPGRQRPMHTGYRKAVGWRWAGLGLGLIVAAETTSLGSLGVGLMLAPTVFGLCVITGVVVGELATTPRRDGVRTAALTTRTVGSYLPRRLGGLVAASTVSLGALLVTTTLMGSADDMGRAGRSLSRFCSPEGAEGPASGGAGPWPGLFYSVPLGIAVMVGLLAAAIALRTVVMRPRSGSAPEVVAADDIARCRSAEAVVAATGVMVAGSMLGVALTAARPLIGSPCPPTQWIVLGVVLLAVGVLMLLFAVWCLALLLTGPRIRTTVSEDTADAGQATSR